jgi:hypothetical protein
VQEKKEMLYIYKKKTSNAREGRNFIDSSEDNTQGDKTLHIKQNT